MKIRSFWWKESCSLKIKVSEVLLCFKDKESDEKVLVFWKDKVLMKVQVRFKKLSDICSLWNVKFYDYESYDILREEDYKEKFSYSSRCF